MGDLLKIRFGKFDPEGKNVWSDVDFDLSLNLFLDGLPWYEIVERLDVKGIKKSPTLRNSYWDRFVGYDKRTGMVRLYVQTFVKKKRDRSPWTYRDWYVIKLCLSTKSRIPDDQKIAYMALILGRSPKAVAIALGRLVKTRSYMVRPKRGDLAVLFERVRKRLDVIFRDFDVMGADGGQRAHF